MDKIGQEAGRGIGGLTADMARLRPLGNQTSDLEIASSSLARRSLLTLFSSSSYSAFLPYMLEGVEGLGQEVGK